MTLLFDFNFRILHKKGVLDDRFKLINPEKLLGLESDDVVDGKSPKAGTKRCRRYYPVELPIEFKNFQVEKCKDGYVLKYLTNVQINTLIFLTALFLLVGLMVLFTFTGCHFFSKKFVHLH